MSANECRPRFDFSGACVLVTGATSGMGKATALRFAQAGASVAASGRDRERGAALHEQLLAGGNAAGFFPGDLAQPAFGEQLVDAAHTALGALDIVINSAGVIHHATVEHTSDAQWQETFAVNVHGVFSVCRAALPRLRAGGGGVIINIASDAGLTGSRHLAAYCASKGAVIQMTRAMALDHAADGIRAIALCPGDVDTPMLRGEFVQRGIEADAGLAESAASVPLQRVCSADEVADLALYAASSAARFMTGYPLVLDGGSRA